MSNAFLGGGFEGARGPTTMAVKVNNPPLITFALFAFNQERFICEAVKSALAQTYAPIEFLFSDDCSTDRTFELMERTVLDDGCRPRSVLVRTNARNLGLAHHINLVSSLATGDFIVVAAGDDISEPHRVQALVSSWCAAGRPDCSVFSAMSEIDQNSKLTGRRFRSKVDWKRMTPRSLLKRNLGVFGASHAWCRSISREFPPLYENVINEDVVIPFRAMLMDGGIYLDDPLVRYRSNIGLASNTAGLRT